MRIERVVLHRVRLPLVSAFRTSFGTETEKDVVLVEVATPAGSGWGECGALSEPGYTYEYTAGAYAVLRDHLVPHLLAGHAAAEVAPSGPDVAAGDVAARLSKVKGHPMAKAALETAVLDAELRAAGVPLASWLGARQTRVPSGVSVGIQPSAAELVATVGRYVDAGYVRIKIKVEPGFDLEPLAAIRSEFGAELPLQADANGAYTLDDAEHLARFDRFGLLFIEQPFDEDDLAAHAALASRIETPVCLDESITSVTKAAEAVERGACSVINLKAGRVGGYFEAKRIHDYCLDAGVPLWCGGMLETGIGRAANLALAALPGFTLPGDLSASDRYFRRDLTEPFVLRDGHLDVPTGPGVGVAPDPQFLRTCRTATDEIPAAR